MTKTCRQCSVDFHIKDSQADKRPHCSRACMAAAYKTRLVGSANPNFRDAGKGTCATCGKPWRGYNKRRRFCSLACRPRRCSKDKNHDEIVSALRAAGFPVLDTWRIGNGFPDAIVAAPGGRVVLIEIKNADYHYGRRGLNRVQRRWADEWQGEKPHVVHTAEEAINVVTRGYP